MILPAKKAKATKKVDPSCLLPNRDVIEMEAHLVNTE